MKQTKLGSFGVKYKPKKGKKSPKPKSYTKKLQALRKKRISGTKPPAKPKSGPKPTPRQIQYAKRIGIKNPEKISKSQLGVAIHVHRANYRKTNQKKANQILKKIGVQHDNKGVYKK